MTKSRPVNEDSLLLSNVLNYLLVALNTPKYPVPLPLYSLIAHLAGHYINEPEKNRPDAYRKEHWEGGK